MADSCTPGTVSHEAMQFLLVHGEASTTALANGIGRSAKRLAQHLSPAERAGIFSRRTEGGFAFWRLGPNADKDQAPEITPDEKIVVKVSAMASPSIFAYADQRSAAPFSSATHTDGRVHTERHGRVIAEYTASEVVILKKALGMLS
jgi:hypothetical protein